MLIAEGSDWFWWYGDDHSSAHDLEFDDLFRRHLRNAYRRLDKPVPDELFVSNITTGGRRDGPDASRPALLRRPWTARRRATSSGSAPGRWRCAPSAGAMHQTSTPAGDGLRWFSSALGREHLYVRLDGPRPMRDLLATGSRFGWCSWQPAPFGVSIEDARRSAGRPVLGRCRARTDSASAVRARRGRGGTVLEVALPLD